MLKILQSALISTLLFGAVACSADELSAPSESLTENTTDTLTENTTGKSLSEIILSFDEDAKVNDNSVQFTLAERPVFLVYDTKADRMRIMTPIGPASLVDEDILIRMLQANHDAVLDARYTLANDLIWSVFIHPLGTLTQDDFLSAVAQTVTAAETFGKTYTSGAMIFGGGDTNTIHEELLKELEEAADKRTKI